MVERVRLKERVGGGGNYFTSPKSNLSFIPSGCKLLDLALGGGWVENRIANVIGDKSSGKTLICIEASANFVRKYPKKGRVKYRETEEAFDPNYAKALGMPIERVDFGEKPLDTIEDLFEDLEQAVKSDDPTLYIVDSLDALSDRAEVGRDMDAGTYGAEKAKKLSQLFRRLTRQMAEANTTLLVVSQVRSKIGFTMGRSTTRSGGRALDFYASQVVYLTQIGGITRTIQNIKRTVGVNVEAKVDKNKVSLPYRSANFAISFGYGIDDLLACLEWLKDAGMLAEAKVPPDRRAKLKQYAREMTAWPDDEYWDELKMIHSTVERGWYDIERSFIPTRRKYEGVSNG